MSSRDLRLEAAALDEGEWEGRRHFLRALPPAETLHTLVDCMRHTDLTSDLTSVSEVDRAILRVAGIAFELIRVAPGERPSSEIESAVGDVADAFAALLASWYGQDRWHGEFVPKASAFSLVMDFALSVGAAQKSHLHPAFRVAAEHIQDAVLRGYVLDVICGDDTG